MELTELPVESNTVISRTSWTFGVDRIGAIGLPSFFHDRMDERHFAIGRVDQHRRMAAGKDDPVKTKQHQPPEAMVDHLEALRRDVGDRLFSSAWEVV
jgi:hypothetical protein